MRCSEPCRGWQASEPVSGPGDWRGMARGPCGPIEEWDLGHSASGPRPILCPGIIKGSGAEPLRELLRGRALSVCGCTSSLPSFIFTTDCSRVCELDSLPCHQHATTSTEPDGFANWTHMADQCGAHDTTSPGELTRCHMEITCHITRWERSSGAAHGGTRFYTYRYVHG